MRFIAGMIVLALAGWLSFAATAPDKGDQLPAGDIVWTTSAQCAECHQEVYDEWKDSWHAKSWIDEDVRVQSNDFANKDCIDCHAPQPVFITKIGNRVLPRSSRRAEGVDCLSCHLRPDGSMAATVTLPGAPCKPVATIELQRVDFCATCHDQHKTVTQWRASEWVDKDQDCIHCHMPFRDGDPTRGRLHGMAGGHDIDLVKTAVELRGRRLDDGRVEVQLENVGAGHSFPTDERSRAADIFWRPAAGAHVQGGWRHLYRIRDPYRMETDIVSTLLHARPHKDSLLTEHIDVGPDTAGAVEVALFYKLTPYYRDAATGNARHTETVDDPESDAELVHLITVEP
jgi:hypothetical protein